jgi:hypothetical protein
VAPARDAGGDLVAGLEDERLQATVEQVYSGGEAHGTRADHGDGERVRAVDHRASPCIEKFRYRTVADLARFIKSFRYSGSP